MEYTSIMDSMDLKVTELLKEVELDYSPSFTDIVNGTVSAIKKSIKKIPKDLTVTGDEAPGFIRDIGADKVEFKFTKPKSIEIGGSYAMKCIAKPHINVDLFIQLPKECFFEKDYLNYRYHAKRCLYLCVIKKYLKSNSSIDKVEWSTFQNEARKPVLLVYPAAKLGEVPGFFVRIIPTATSLFDVSKLNLKRNSVRALNREGSEPVPTPMYNGSILEDMFIEENSELLRQTFAGWKELGEALVLLKVWARQRSSIYAHDCLNGFLIAIILSYLVTYEKLNKSMKPLQMFRVTLDFIASSKLWSQGLFLQKHGKAKISKEDRMLYKESFPVVICDTYTHTNFTFRIKESALAEIQDEAALTLKCFEKSGDGAFEDIFMTKIDFPAKYDLCVRLNLKGNTEFYASGLCLDDECWRLYELKVHNLLRQGLGDRAKSIRVIWRNVPSECSIENGVSSFDGEPLLVGVSISSSEKAFRVVDIGPDAENKVEAAKFRKFWGEKAELRRFKDGKIAESVVWESEQWMKHHILPRIIEHVLLRHLSISKTSMVQVVDQLDFALLLGVGDPMSFSASLLGAFELLAKRLRLIEDIPLKVSSVQPLDPAFRSTSVFPPEPHPLAIEKGVPKLRKPPSSCIQALEVMIQLEGSGNWPMDDLAIEKTKSSFLLKIGESLENSWGMTCNATEDDVDVFLSGYAFRLKILHERSLSLVKGEIGGVQAKRVSSADKKLLVRSLHSSMINGLQGLFPIYGPVTRLAKRWVASHMFSACLADEAVELLVAHLFVKPFPFTAPCSRVTGFLRLISAVVMGVAATDCLDGQFSFWLAHTPQTHRRFLHRFLRLLAEYDWRFSSLVVDINNDLTPSDKKEIYVSSEVHLFIEFFMFSLATFMTSRKDFEENRQNLCPAMFLATSYDRASEAWTKSSPNSLELNRLVAYARSSANLLNRLILQDQSDNYRWECLFRTPLTNYDAVILLHGDKLPYPQRLLFPSKLSQGKLVAQGNASKAFRPFILPENLMGSTEELKEKLMVNFDPLTCYVTDLEASSMNESNRFKMWYDSLGGDAIGLTWERSSSKKRGREEAGEEAEDPIHILKAAGEVGKGFVRSVHFLKSPRLTS
ncbi:hypothetical protein Tsubulata_014141 [Turnera subulata]|uniref:Nucleolar protein 6 n=1 Tax=Turnera subulata TaxID=218843 RepID=A0A9Q0GKI3_9ROSI|nr:hypothetical protein Tsubulata_014141 [Turnera subulata]